MRDLVRARQAAVRSLRQIRQQLSGFLLRHGHHYQRPAWTKVHRALKRLGTATLSAAVDLVSGFVHHVVTQRHRSREFIAFLERLDAHYPARMLICLLLDNHAGHCSRETRRFLAGKPGRLELVFTPTHTSSLNYVETFFSKVARSGLRRIRVASKAELAERIRRYIEMCNAAPVLPRWRYGITPEPQALAA